MAIIWLFYLLESPQVLGLWRAKVEGVTVVVEVVDVVEVNN